MNSKSIFSIKSMVTVALFTAILAVVAPFTIPLPGISFSLAPFIIVITGGVLGPKLGSVTVLLYVFIGALGLPVFSNHQAGIQVLFGPTGGFLFGYVFLALMVGLGRHRSIPVSISFAFVGMTICYLCGVLSLRIVTGSFAAALTLPVLFVKDLVVAVLASSISREIVKRTKMIQA